MMYHASTGTSSRYSSQSLRICFKTRERRSFQLFDMNVFPPLPPDPFAHRRNGFRQLSAAYFFTDFIVTKIFSVENVRLSSFFG